jgi:LexA-binding, inner membrane-associated putative hydrolase
MTSPEHTLVGIHVAFAMGLHRMLGWRSVAMAGIVSNVPDWDGLPMLIDMQRFESGHRAWGHGILSIVLTSLVLGCSQNQWDWIGRISRRMRIVENDRLRAGNANFQRSAPTISGAIAFTTVGLLSQALHLPCDMVVSGGNGLSDWAIKPWWPFFDASYVYPLIPWGDVGPIILMMAGIIAIAKCKTHISKISWITIVALCIYLVARGWSRGMLMV